MTTLEIIGLAVLCLVPCVALFVVVGQRDEARTTLRDRSAGEVMR